ncbi:hypothetical protein H920_11816 [Fukomys damarensis]|uniref:Uncharacterized protein n=1 Tax=Fukomys damarensis TaxID=885580 RepID=A0A091D8E4_FUKDA|nr:hypothetical protein H920_11816 [Fukomys damarensis]
MDVSSVADVEGPSVRTVRAVAVLDSVLKQKLRDSRRLLVGEQLLDAHLSGTAEQVALETKREGAERDVSSVEDGELVEVMLMSLVLEEHPNLVAQILHPTSVDFLASTTGLWAFQVQILNIDERETLLWALEKNIALDSKSLAGFMWENAGI